MQNLQYAEILEDDEALARERERMAFDRSIELMERADRDGASSVDTAKAIIFTNTLWAFLIEDLARPTNGLPKELRAKLISIGIWTMREIEKMRIGDRKSFADVIQVSKAIRGGLS